MKKQWERKRKQTKPHVKDASKRNCADTGHNGSATVGPVPTPGPSQPQVTIQSTQQPALSTFPPIAQPHQFATFPQFPVPPLNVSPFPAPFQNAPPFPVPPPNLPPYSQVNAGYMAPMFPHNATPFGPSSGFPDFSAHPQNPYQYYPTPGPYWPTRDDRFPEPMPNQPIPSGSRPYHPFHHTAFPEPHHRHKPTNHQPRAPIHHPPPQPLRGYTEPDPTFEDRTRFPLLQEWLTSIDDDSTRATHGDEYLQYSSAFETRGLRSLLDLEDVSSDQLFEQFGIPEALARRLLRLAMQDIWSIRDIRT